MDLDARNLCLLSTFVILGLGLYGLLTIRNLIKIVIVLQVLVKAALLSLVGAGISSGQIHLSQSLAMTVIVADTVVAVVGMALAVQVHRRVGSLDVQALSKLRG